MTASTEPLDTPPPTEVTNALLDQWATDPLGPVALHLKQRLLPVEAEEGKPSIIYPPTYADIGYNIDKLPDDTQVAMIDSVGSQANRVEPIFKNKFQMSDGSDEERWLVPQVEIYLQPKCGPESADETPREKRSLLDLAHRIADAVVKSSTDLADQVDAAFQALRRTGDARPLCVLAPTSLVFGVWDSRGTGEKRPRLVRAIIRAWDVAVLHAAAQFNSVWKALDKDDQDALKKEAKAKKAKLSEKGLADAPATFRKTRIPEYGRDGLPNPEARVLGGVWVRGRIEREVTVNLLALRNLHGPNDEETIEIRKYLLGLSLIAATAEIDLFLREGCHLRYADVKDVWHEVPRRGKPATVDLGSDLARARVIDYTIDAASNFRGEWLDDLEYQFDLAEAKKLLAKKAEEEPDED